MAVALFQVHAAPSSERRHGACSPLGQTRLLSPSSRISVLTKARTAVDDEQFGASKNSVLSSPRLFLDAGEHHASWQTVPPTKSADSGNAPVCTRPKRQKLWHQILQDKARNIKEASTLQLRNWERNLNASSRLKQILEQDKRAVAAALKWTNETVVPVLRDALFLMDFAETPVVSQDVTWQPTSYRGLSGWELLRADVSTMQQYFNFVLLQLAAWQAPLQAEYDPEQLASYFGSRPHLLLFRTLEVSAAFSNLLLWFIFERNIKRMFWSNPPSPAEDTRLALRTAEAFKGAMVQLGPTFVKAAQSLSTRSDLVGPDTAKVLADLQDRLPPFPNEQAMDVIKKELGRPVDEVFDFLSDEPVAAASLGQVYRGRTKDGQIVAVKVQRPAILFSIARDIYILRLGLGMVRKVGGINRDLSVFADEIGRGLFGELDYRQEAANASEFQMSLTTKLPFIVVPKTLPHLTTRRVMTMEWISGTRPVDLRRAANGQDGECSPEKQQSARRRLIHMVNKGVQSSLTQLLDAGILHADPHPGNIIYTPDNKIGYLDFGLICRMEKRHQHAMLAATAHLVNGDWNFLVDDLAEMDVLKPSIDRFRLELALDGALSDFVVKRGLPNFRFSEMVGKLLKVALKFRFRLPPYYMLILRSIASLEGMALAVDPNFKVFTKTYPFVIRKLICDKSAAMQRTLRSLLLTSKRELRMDRIASFMSLRSQDVENVDKEEPLDSIIWRLFLSSDGAALRRIVLEANTRSLALAFLSKDAAPVRLKVTNLLTGIFYWRGRQMLQMNTETQQQQEQQQELQQEQQQQQLLSMLRSSKHLRFLAAALWQRLSTMPLVMIRVAWSCLAIACCSGALAFHRLAIDYALLNA